MKVLFMGTPDFGARVLQGLVENNFEVVGVVTQPDRPSGRRNIFTPPAVKKTAQELGLPVMQVERLKEPEVLEDLRKFGRGAEVFVVAAFGMLLPGPVLEMPPLKCINVHGSLLPKYRGASPVVQALLEGSPETGVTIMLMEKGLDTGPMLSKAVVLVGPGETQISLMVKLAEAGSKLLVETLPAWGAGLITPQPQDNSQATLTGIIKKEAGKIDWNEPAGLIERKTRAYFPWPGAYTYWGNQTLKIIKAEVGSPELARSLEAEKVIPGKVLSEINQVKAGRTLAIATGAGLLLPLELQLAGKKVVPVKDFLLGQPDIIGSQLG